MRHVEILGAGEDGSGLYQVMPRLYQRGPHEYAAELDTILPEDRHQMLRRVIDEHLPEYELKRLKEIERIENETLLQAIERTS